MYLFATPSQQLARAYMSWFLSISNLYKTQIAVQSFRLETCEFLLKAGADPKSANGRLVELRLLVKSVWTLILQSQSAHAVAWSHIYENAMDRRALTTLQKLFPADEDDLERQKFSRLHKIVLGIEKTDLALALTIDSAILDINATDIDGKTPLMWAASRRDSEAVKALIINGADPNICNRYSQSALMRAVKSNSLACVELLLQAGASIVHKDFQQFSIMHYAAVFSNDVQLVRCLRSVGAEIEERECRGLTPIFYTALNNHYRAARALSEYGANLDVADRNGDSFLHQSLFFSAKNVLRLLLDHGASLTPRNAAGRSILHYAALYGDLETLQILLSTDLGGLDPDVLDLDGSPPIQLALKRENISERFIEKLQELFNEIRAKNTKQSTTETGSINETLHENTYGTQPDRTASYPVRARQIIYRVFVLSQLATYLTWRSLLLHCILGLGWAGFLYQLLRPKDSIQRERYS